MVNLILALAGIVALIVGIGRLLHSYCIYLPDRARSDPKDAGLSGVEEVVFKATDGTKLIAWYRPARGSKPTLLYFTGNSGNAASRAGKIRAITADDYGVFMLNYRRYGGSEGWPSETRITADALSAYDCLRGLVWPRTTSSPMANRSARRSQPGYPSSAMSKRSCSKRRSPRSSMSGDSCGRDSRSA